MAGPSADQIKDFNVRYHDLAAIGYDEKWGIDFGARGRAQVRAKVAKALGAPPPRYERALEIGAGTGYFGLNLALDGTVARPAASDISQGMLDTLSASARALDIEVETACCEAAELPFGDASFDLVFGHAVLHHLPDLDAAFAELARVLRPGGTVAFCGEPSHHGDRLAAVPKRAATLAAPTWRRILRAPPRRNGGANGVVDGSGHRDAPREEERLERTVDVHAFRPDDLVDHARRAGLSDVRVTGEELTASWFGWANRTLESTAARDELPWLWYQWAYRGYLTLQRLDRAVLEPRLPATVFYNLLLSARKPA